MQNSKAPILRQGDLTVNALLSSIDNSRAKNKEQIKLACLLAFTGGLRISEALALTSEQVRFDGSQAF